MARRRINDPFCGHSCYDDVMVPQEKPSYPIGDIMLDHVVEAVKEDHEGLSMMKKSLKKSFGTLDEYDVDLEPLMKTLMPLQRL